MRSTACAPTNNESETQRRLHSPVEQLSMRIAAERPSLDVVRFSTAPPHPPHPPHPPPVATPRRTIVRRMYWNLPITYMYPTCTCCAVNCVLLEKVSRPWRPFHARQARQSVCLRYMHPATHVRGGRADGRNGTVPDLTSCTVSRAVLCLGYLP